MFQIVGSIWSCATKVIIGIVLLVLFAFMLGGGGCSANPIADMAQAKRDEAAARRSIAAAEEARAEADKIYARGYADAMSQLTEVAADAVSADTIAAHPLQWALRGVASFLLLILAFLAVAILVIGVATTTNPDIADLLIGFVESRSSRAEPQTEESAEQVASAHTEGQRTCSAHKITYNLSDYENCPLCQIT